MYNVLSTGASDSVILTGTASSGHGLFHWVLKIRQCKLNWFHSSWHPDIDIARNLKIPDHHDGICKNGWFWIIGRTSAIFRRHVTPPTKWHHHSATYFRYIEIWSISKLLNDSDFHRNFIAQTSNQDTYGVSIMSLHPRPLLTQRSLTFISWFFPGDLIWFLLTNSE